MCVAVAVASSFLTHPLNHKATEAALRPATPRPPPTSPWPPPLRARGAVRTRMTQAEQKRPRLPRAVMPFRAGAAEDLSLAGGSPGEE